MSFWRIDPQTLDSPAVQLLSAEDFKAALLGAMAGEVTPFSPFVTGPYIRPPANEWAEIRLAVFQRDDFTCTYCQSRGVQLECDHIVPVAKGGMHEMDNLTTACRPCNRKKRDKLLVDWRP